VPVNATLLVAVLSLVLGFYFSTREDGISLLSTLVNFGALSAFLALHVSVVWFYVGRQGSHDWWRHLIAPTIGFLILAYVLINAQLQAKWLGLIWFAVGLVALIVLVAMGRRPELSAIDSVERE
jgi:amino acid transporter